MCVYAVVVIKVVQTNIYKYICIDHVASIICVNSNVILPRVRFSGERFAVYNAEAVFGLLTMENGISKIILPKEP